MKLLRTTQAHQALTLGEGADLVTIDYGGLKVPDELADELIEAAALRGVELEAEDVTGEDGAAERRRADHLASQVEGAAVFGRPSLPADAVNPLSETAREARAAELSEPLSEPDVVTTGDPSSVTTATDDTSGTVTDPATETPDGVDTPDGTTSSTGDTTGETTDSERPTGRRGRGI